MEGFHGQVSQERRAHGNGESLAVEAILDLSTYRQINCRQTSVGRGRWRSSERKVYGEHHLVGH